MSARGEEAAGEASGSQPEPEPAPPEPKKRGPGRPRKPQQVSVNPQESLSPNDQGDGPKEARTRAPPKQCRRKLRPQGRRDLGEDPGNGHSKWSRKSPLWKKKRRRRSKKRTKQPQDFTSTSSSCQLSPREKTALTTYY